MELAQGGIWTVRVIIASDSGAPIVLDAPIVIDRWPNNGDSAQAIG